MCATLGFAGGTPLAFGRESCQRRPGAARLESIRFHPVPWAHEVAGVAGVVTEVGDSAWAIDEACFGIVSEHKQDSFRVVAAVCFLPPVVGGGVSGGDSEEWGGDVVGEAGELAGRCGVRNFGELWAKGEEREFHREFENARHTQKDEEDDRIRPVWMELPFAAKLNDSGNTMQIRMNGRTIHSR